MKIIRISVLVAAAASLWSCRQKAPAGPPLAKPSIVLSHEKAPLGSPIEITYRFEVDANPPPIGESYKVFIHFVDADGELMWTDDHDPPTPTTQWKAGQKIEYTRTVFIPLYPYIGDASINVGVYSMTSQKRVPLSGEDVGQLAYRVAKLQLSPQTDNLYTIFKDGWHHAEAPANDPRTEWQWTKKKEATLAFKNPRRDSLLYFEVDNPSKTFPEGQHVQVKLGNRVLVDFTLEPQTMVLHKVPLLAAQLGSEEMVDLTIAVDKTFVPAQVPGMNSTDPRELGIRVFRAFVQPNR